MTSAIASSKETSQPQKCEAPASRIKPSIASRVWSTVSKPSCVVSSLTALGTTAMGCSAPVVATAYAGCQLLGKLAKNVVFGGRHLRPGVFLGTEYLSNAVQGGLHDSNIPPILDSLKKLPQTSRVVEAQRRLQDINTYISHFDFTGINNGPLVKRTLKSIRDLQEGESISIPCSRFTIGDGFGHLMVMTITRRLNNKYLVEVHNTGEGTGEYHYLRRDEFGRKLIQTVLQFDDVVFEDIEKILPDLAALHAFRLGNSTAQLYKVILPKLKGKILEPQKSKKFWSSGQTGTSCSGYSLRSLLKRTLNQKEYGYFKTQFIADTAHGLFEGMNSYRPWEQTSLHQAALRESVTVLKERVKTFRCQVSKHVEDLMEGRTSIPKTTALGKAAEKISTKFWKIIFNTRDTGELEHALRSTDICLRKHPFFDGVNEPMVRFIEAEVRDVAAFTSQVSTELDKLYNSIDRTKLSKADLKRIDTCYKECCRRIVSGGGWYPTIKESLDKFKEACFVYINKTPIQTKLGHHLMSFIQAFKQNDFTKARSHLNKAYEFLARNPKFQLDRISFYDCQLAAREISLAFQNRNMMTLEQRDLGAGAIWLVNELSIRRSHKIQEFLYYNHNDRNFLFDYSPLQLSKYFPQTPWAKRMGSDLSKRHSHSVETPSGLARLKGIEPSE